MEQPKNIGFGKRVNTVLPRDYEDELHLENGNYLNYCQNCSHLFRGYKRRQICKTCANNTAENQ